ncbi:hypothetical protein JHK85_004683 [Glycine max]|nr:hypothetical protein JHK85_004683 [Glycine max]
MARIPNKIKGINGSKETLKLAVRITDLWFVGTPDKSEQAEMIIVDSDGDQIHVVCKRDQLKSWKLDLKENCTYVMHNFKVIKNDGQYRVCDHPYKLVFTGVTVVRQTDLDNVPFKKYNFTQFANIIAGHFQPGLLVGLYPPSVSNSLKASKLLINQPVAEIQEFKHRLSELGIEVHSVITPRGQGSSQLSGYCLCYRGHHYQNCYGKSFMVLSGLHPMSQKIDIDTASFTCACGKYNEQVVLRYRLEVMVSHKEESTKFLLWDRECTDLIGQSADEVNRFNQSSGMIRDLSLINIIMELLPDAEASSRIHIALPDSSDPPHHESQSLSRTADHDPLLRLPLTPTKRQISQECDDEARSSQISPAQLSSNKLGKHVKIE